MGGTILSRVLSRTKMATLQTTSDVVAGIDEKQNYPHPSQQQDIPPSPVYLPRAGDGSAGSPQKNIAVPRATLSNEGRAGQQELILTRSHMMHGPRKDSYASIKEDDGSGSFHWPVESNANADTNHRRSPVIPVAASISRKAYPQPLLPSSIILSSCPATILGTRCPL